MPDTSTPLGARDHARAQMGTAVDTAPTVPAREAGDLPHGIAADQVVWDETLGAGGYASHVLDRHSRLRLTDLEGDGCIALLVYNAATTSERLNVADTVKVQWQAYLSAGSLLLSDMGRVMMSITEDSCGHHDSFCGTSTARTNERKYGDGAVSGPHPSGRDRFALALAKHGMGPVDIMANVNLFKGVRVAADGSLDWVEGSSRPGDVVELRAEMRVLVVVANVPHVLDPRPEYEAGKVRLLAYRGPPTPADDPCRAAGPESERAYLNTEDLLLA
jgi:uncharacterized protein